MADLFAPARNAGSASPEPWLAAVEKRFDAFHMILRHARQRELIDVHVAGEIVERIGETVDGQLRHRNRYRWLRRDLVRKNHRRIEGLAGLGQLLDEAPFAGFFRADALIGENYRLLGP